MSAREHRKVVVSVDLLCRLLGVDDDIRNSHSAEDFVEASLKTTCDELDVLWPALESPIDVESEVRDQIYRVLKRGRAALELAALLRAQEREEDDVEGAEVPS